MLCYLKDDENYIGKFYYNISKWTEAECID